MTQVIFSLFWLVSGLIFALIWHIYNEKYTHSNQFVIDTLDLPAFGPIEDWVRVRLVAMRLKYAEWILLSYIALIMYYRNKHRPMKKALIFYIRPEKKNESI